MEDYKKIKLLKTRDFGDNFSTILEFIKQNYITILKQVCYFIPIILITSFMLLDMQGMNSMGMTDMDDLVYFFTSSVLILPGLILMVFLSVGISGYTACYMSQYSESADGFVDTKAVWQELKRVFFPLLFINILYSIALVLGLLLCLIPGIVIGVYFAFTSFVCVVEKRSIFDTFTRSWDLIRDNWWVTFGTIFIIGIILWIISFVFGLPAQVSSLGMLFDIEMFSSDIYMYIASFVSQIGQILIAPLSTIALGVLYFSRKSDLDYLDMDDEINEIGSNNDQTPPPFN